MSICVECKNKVYTERAKNKQVSYCWHCKGFVPTKKGKKK